MPKAAPVPDLLDDIFDAEQFSQENLAGSILWLPLAKIYDNPFQPRQHYDDEHIQRLADNIWGLRNELPGTHGLQQPPVARVVSFGDDGDVVVVDRTVYGVPASVRKLARSERYAVELHFGHRRSRAWKLLATKDERYTRFPLLLAYADDRSMWRHAISENAQRKDISAVDEAWALRWAVDRFGMTQEQAGEPFGYAKATVSNKLRLLNLPEDLLALLAAGQISEKHARTLLRLAPAPHLYSEFATMRLQWLLQASEAELSRAISELIWKRLPLPPQPNTGYSELSNWQRDAEPRTVAHNPPEWPYDWQPPDGVGVGACIGCRFYAHFGGDPGARCSATTRSCYDAKTVAWRKAQSVAQIAALVDTSPVTSVAPAAPPMSGASAAALPTNGSQPQPAAPPIMTALSSITWFSTDAWRGAPAALVEKGHCSKERCECWTLAYNPDAADHHVRPDADKAPNLCIGCKSVARLRNRRTEMEHGDVQAHRKRIKAEEDEAERLLLAWLESACADDIWHNLAFLRSLVVYGVDILRSHEGRDWDTHMLQERLFVGVAAKQCKTWYANVPHWALDKVRAWLADLDIAIGRAELPVPQFDARIEAAPEPLTAADLTVMRPAPLATYTDDDERNHQCLMSEWDGASWQSLEKLMRRCAYDDDPPCVVTPTVIRHIAQDCPADGVRRDMLALAEWLETVAEVSA